MKKTTKTFFTFTTILFLLLQFTPSHSSAASYTNQQVTCYLSNSGDAPARPGGYSYVQGTTAASQYKTYNRVADGPRIPFGTWVTLSQTVHLPNGQSKRTFRIDDMGDRYQKRTPYFVDVYFGLNNVSNRTLCTGFGEKRMTVSW